MTRDEVLDLFASTGTTRIKLCGLSRQQDVAAANNAYPDLAGFVVDFPRSHRNVPSTALAALTRDVATGIVRVGVFVDEPVETIGSLYGQGALDAVQLHGNETESYLEALRRICDAPIVQAIRVRSREDVARAMRSTADLVLLDSGQGTGKTFDWSLVQDIRRPFLLAGGLNPANVSRAVAATHPWGVDLSSGIESDGLKDPEKMRAAVRAIREIGTSA